MMQQEQQDADLKMETSKCVAIRHAAAVAAASIEKKLASTSSTHDTVLLIRQLTELRRCSLQSELDFLDVLVRMTNEQKLQTLFVLLDTDGSGTVSAHEMARCLKKMDTTGRASFAESLQAAVLSIQAFDEDHDGLMDISEFADFVEELVHNTGCAFEDLAQFLTLRVAFADSGSSVLDEAIVALVQDSTESSSVEDFNDAVVEVRMMLLFQMMDYPGKAEVPFEDVVKSLHHVTKRMDDTARKALLMFGRVYDEENQRVVDYPQFSSLLLNVMAAGTLNFHDVANSMTLTFCKDDVTRTDLADLFVSSETYHNALSEMQKDETNANNNTEDLMDVLQYGRMNRLFDLWDLDHSGELDVSEFVLGMRKFHEAKDMDKSVEEGISAMMSFDKDQNHKLNRTEFASLLIRFAKATKVPLHDLIDFMVVTSAVKDNSRVEQAYIESVRARARERLKHKLQDSARTIGGLWRNLRRGNSVQVVNKRRISSGSKAE